MKRPCSSSDSIGEGDDVYGGSFRAMLEGVEDEECSEELLGGGGGGVQEKKRRLRAEQVRALERSFEVENKLEPERKARLAQDLGLQPRQVAVWFQNRRARWKTKQLERDYNALRARYDELKLDFDALHRDNQSLLAEIVSLKSKLSSDDTSSVKNEPLASDSDNKEVSLQEPPALIYKDGSRSSESDSSAVLNSDDRSPAATTTTTLFPQHHDHHFFTGYAPNHTSTSPAPPSAPAPKLGLFYQPMKLEDATFLPDDDEPCSRFFSDEQPPSLSWYCSDHHWS